MERDTFPYKVLPDEDVVNRFENLSRYQFEFAFPLNGYRIYNLAGFYPRDLVYLPDGCGVIIRNFDTDYEDMNLISCKWMDRHRVRAKRKDQGITPWEYWCRNRVLVRQKSMEFYRSTDPFYLRETVYKLTHEATAFRPSLAVGFVKMFGCKRVLDFSAGWGDRLIGCLAANVNMYCGVDPNGSLHPEYVDIAKFFGGATQTVFVASPFETAEIPVPAKGFDLVFTSPPYFDLECYSSSETQSTHNRTLSQWLEQFMYVSLSKAWGMMCKGGYLILVLNDQPKDGHKYCVQVVKYMKALPGAEYMGVISYSEFDSRDNPISPQPCWIVRKVT